MTNNKVAAGLIALVCGALLALACLDPVVVDKDTQANGSWKEAARIERSISR